MQHLFCAPQYVAVHTEHDVIMLRQSVRAMARNLGLGLVQQARLATAISAIARALVEESGGTRFTLQAIRTGLHPALEISCIPSIAQKIGDKNVLEQRLLVGEARSLVDEANLAMLGEEIVLTLRMWLGR